MNATKQASVTQFQMLKSRAHAEPNKPSKKTSKSHQKGAIGIFGVLTLLLVVLFTALAVDSARLWMIKRQLQKVADMSAIEASKALGCNPDIAQVIARAQQTATENGYTGNLTNTPNIVEIGNVNTSAGRHQFTADGSPRAVHVRVTSQVPSSLLAQGFYSNQVILSAEAVSLPSISMVSFGIGTTALKLNTQESLLLNGLLGGMLGTPINLDVLDYQGLADTKLTLLDLIHAQGQALSVDEILDMPFTQKELLTLISNATGLRNDAIPDALNATTALANASIKNTTISLGQIIKINQNVQSSAATVGMNLFSLLTSVISLSNGQNAITLPVGVNLPGLASVNAIVKVIEPQQMVIGSVADANGNICNTATARNAQIRVNVATLVTVPLLAKVDLNLGVEVASGSASLRKVAALGNATELTFDTNSSLVTTKLTNNAGNKGAIVSTLLGIELAEIGLNVTPEASSSNVVVAQADWPIAESLPKTISVNNGLGTTFDQLLSSSLTIKPLGLDLLGVLNPVLNTLVKPLLVTISNSVISPLLNVFGISVNNMDIIVDDISLGNPSPLVI